MPVFWLTEKYLGEGEGLRGRKKGGVRKKSDYQENLRKWWKVQKRRRRKEKEKKNVFKKKILKKINKNNIYNNILERKLVRKRLATENCEIYINFPSRVFFFLYTFLNFKTEPITTKVKKRTREKKM